MVQTVEKTSKNQRNEVNPNRARGAVEGAHYATSGISINK